MAGVWLYRGFRHDFDEKQRLDTTRVARTAWLASFPVLFALFAYHYHLSGPFALLWLPSYCFSTLLIFSLSGIYYDRRG